LFQILAKLKVFGSLGTVLIYLSRYPDLETAKDLFGLRVKHMLKKSEKSACLKQIPFSDISGQKFQK